jgi:arylsulfatase A-like enzyme
MLATMPRRSALLLLSSLSLLASGCRGDAPRPSLLLVSIDSLRADRLGSYGNPRDTSPTLDRLAAEGVRFANAHSPTTWTLPAHVTLLTGRQPHRHGTVRMADRIAPDEVLLAERLRAEGYETVGFFSGVFLDPSFGFDRGFERYVSCEPEESPDADRHQRNLRALREPTNPKILEKFERWLGERSERPFFAFVHMWDVHYDYVPPDPYASMFDGDYEGPLDGREIEGAGFPLDASPRDVEHLLALYDAEIRYTDHTLGRMLAQLDAKGLLDHTVVAVTADHGEEFLDHGGKGHGNTLHQEIIRVPLILWSKSLLHAGRVVEVPVSLADVAPTLLELTGLAPPERADGRSLLALARGETSEHPPVYSVIYDRRFGRLSAASLRQGDRKLIYRAMPPAWQAYDLAADPGERGWTQMDWQLQAELERRVREAPVVGSGAQGEASPDPATTLRKDIADRLRALGYLE